MQVLRTPGVVPYSMNTIARFLLMHISYAGIIQLKMEVVICHLVAPILLCSLS